MARLAVFDSGLGSLSIIRAIQGIVTGSEIIYFADQKNYPYGNKSHAQLRTIINRTIKALNHRFSPDLVVMASNTPTLMLGISHPKVIGVRPPLSEAAASSMTKNIGILGTKSAISSQGLDVFIKENNFPKSVTFHKINGSILVDLVESGMFLTDQKQCKKIIKQTLSSTILKNSIDTVTLSSTHLPFLQSLLEDEFPHVTFMDPGHIVAKSILNTIKDSSPKNSSLTIYTSGNPEQFQKHLSQLGIKSNIRYLSI